MSSFFEPQSIEWIHEVDLFELAIVKVAIAPNRPGRVYWRATFWFAQAVDVDLDTQVYVDPDTIVKVIGRCGLILLVMKM
jgi:hypothetical protein